VRLRADQVDSQLARNLAPVWLVHGDEPLLALEAADAVRAAARKRGHVEREVHFIERAFDWSLFTQSAASQSLFGDRKIVELRFATGSPPPPRPRPSRRTAASRIRTRCCWSPCPGPRARAGGNPAGSPPSSAPERWSRRSRLTRAQLPQWLAQRLARQKQSASSDALELMADRVEGNLLAAQQEILKLALLAPEGELSPAQNRRRRFQRGALRLRNAGRGALRGRRRALPARVGGLARRG
jgi:DNA polymerase-3 subunit delta